MRVGAAIMQKGRITMTHENLIRARNEICKRQAAKHLVSDWCEGCPLEKFHCMEFEFQIETVRQAVKDDPSLIGSENAK